jgi:hypothetical protein
MMRHSDHTTGRKYVPGVDGTFIIYPELLDLPHAGVACPF